MRSLAENQDVAGLHKMPTGVEGFDAITGGGLPRNRTSLSATTVAPEASQARVSSGVERLDAMLGRGYFRGFWCKLERFGCQRYRLE